MEVEVEVEVRVGVGVEVEVEAGRVEHDPRWTVRMSPYIFINYRKKIQFINLLPWLSPTSNGLVSRVQFSVGNRKWIVVRVEKSLVDNRYFPDLWRDRQR